MAQKLAERKRVQTFFYPSAECRAVFVLYWINSRLMNSARCSKGPVPGGAMALRRFRHMRSDGDLDLLCFSACKIFCRSRISMLAAGFSAGGRPHAIDAWQNSRPVYLFIHAGSNASANCTTISTAAWVYPRRRLLQSFSLRATKFTRPSLHGPRNFPRAFAVEQTKGHNIWIHGAQHVHVDRLMWIADLQR